MIYVNKHEHDQDHFILRYFSHRGVYVHVCACGMCAHLNSILPTKQNKFLCTMLGKCMFDGN